MKIKTILVILLLMSFSLILASEDSADAEHWEKVRQLNQLAERFKAETGFTGESCSFDKRGRIKSVTGAFKGIPIPDIPDTLVIRQAFTTILNRIMPYIDAPSEQLQIDRVFRMGNFWATHYTQLVNGYQVHDGRLSITYYPQRRTFKVANSTIIIPYSTLVSKLNYEDALGIFNSNVEDAYKLKDVPLSRIYASNVYCDVNKYKDDENPEYRLCWIIGSEKIMAIDAITGEIHFRETNEFTHLNLAVKGIVNTNLSDNGNLADTLTVSFPDTYVRASCDSLPQSDYCDQYGNITFEGQSITNVVSVLQSWLISVFDGSNPEDELPVQNNLILPSESNPNVLMYDFTNHIGNPSNQYYHANEYIDYVISNYSSPLIFNPVRVVTGETMNQMGSYDSYNNIIHVNSVAAHHSSPICHELTHAIVYKTLEDSMVNFSNNNQTTGGMDEAYATYYPCAYRGNPIFWNSPDYQFDLSDHSNVTSIVIDPIAFNESKYSDYSVGRFIASAWWRMRENEVFDSNELSQVDALLVSVLNEIKLSGDDRYRPRLFFNKLMSIVDDDNDPWPLNEKQVVIKHAYDERGLFFSPDVISTVKYECAEEADSVEVNKYLPGQKISSRVFNMPQNTCVYFHVVPHRSSGYSDNMLIDSLNPLLSKVAISDISGTAWVEFDDSENLAPGEYDIIADIGWDFRSDNRIWTSYASYNVVDAIDGRGEPGFIVTNLGDAVVALDFSSSMDAYGLQQTARIPTIHRK